MKFSVLFLSFFISFSAISQDQKEEAGFVSRWWDATRNKYSLIMDEGWNDVYVAGYAYHDRNTYTKEKLKDLNEGAYGGGVGRSRVNEKGNTEMLFLMAHLDSHSDVQVNAGYAWVKKFDIVGNSKVGIGFSAGLVSRSDFAGRIPIPYALPLVTVDIGNVSINTIVIPKLNDGINNGNVLFIFGKFTWERKKEAASSI